MRTWCCLTILLCLAGDAVAGAAVDVPVGQSMVLNVPGIERVAVGDGEILSVDALEGAGEVLLIGLSPGLTDVRTWSETGKRTHRLVRVHEVSTATNRPQLEYLIDDIAGVQFRQINGEMLVTGTAESKADFERIQAITDTYPAVKSFVDEPGLEGTPTIYIKARFVEVRRSTLEKIGFDWSDNSPAIGFSYASDYVTNDFFSNRPASFANAGSLPLDIGVNNGYLGIGFSLNSILNLLGQNGETTTIAEPTLSCLSGSDAEFQAGGEVPIPVQSADGALNVVFKDYGILLKVSPAVLSDNSIRTHVEVEVSDVDESVTVRGVPGFSVRNASTEMNAPSGETLVIAGLVDSEDSRSVDKIPGLGDLPVLGELFRSQAFQNEKTELVVMVTPYTAQDVPRWSRSRVERVERLAKNPRAAKRQLPLLE